MQLNWFIELSEASGVTFALLCSVHTLNLSTVPERLNCNISGHVVCLCRVV